MAPRSCCTATVVDDAFDKARELELENGYVFVHAFDDPQIIAGAGTVGVEMVEDAPDLDCIVVPIGGGGLMSGIATAAKALKPDIDVDRGRGRALPVDEMRGRGLPAPARRRHAGRGHCGQAARHAHPANSQGLGR